jgi:hypothetical protein
MHWKEQLKTRIESLKDEDWEPARIFGQPGPLCAVIKIDCGPVVSDHSPNFIFRVGPLNKAMNSVNDREFCGADRGKLTLREFSWDHAIHLTFVLIRETPWNALFDFEKPIFSEYDFNSLP